MAILTPSLQGLDFTQGNPASVINLQPVLSTGRSQDWEARTAARLKKGGGAPSDGAFFLFLATTRFMLETFQGRARKAEAKDILVLAIHSTVQRTQYPPLTSKVLH